MMRSFRLLISYAILSGLAMWIVACGGSSVKNPTQELDEETPLSTLSEQSLDVSVDISQDTVRPGETIQMTATVEPIQSTRVLLNWINVTKHGNLSVANPNSATWVAPAILDGVAVRVEVIQLVVTAIIQVVSVKESGVETGTQILTETKTVLLTVTAN